MSLYPTLLLAHSYLRWLVLVVGVAAVVRAFAAIARRRPHGTTDTRLGGAFIGAVDLQIVLGLLLYVVASPFTAAAFGDVGAAMKVSSLRFWLVEHPFAVVVGAALVHIGRNRIRHAPQDGMKHRRARLYYGLALLAFAVGVPWPGLPYSRPLLRVDQREQSTAPAVAGARGLSSCDGDFLHARATTAVTADVISVVALLDR